MNSNGLSGLVNLGNTCYLNSALQCLSNTIPLTEYFLSNQYLQDINRNSKEYSLCNEYKRLLSALWEDSCVVKPLAFKAVLGECEKRFSDNSQHDSHEVLTTIIDMLHMALSYEVNINCRGTIQNEVDKLEIESIKTWSNYFKKQYSNILDIFYGQYSSVLVCPNCKKQSNSFDPFCSITLPITSETNNLYDCFDKFTSAEVLDTDNQWKCEDCQLYGNSIKKINIWKSPKILVVVLKRFNNFSKISKNINFPLEDLDLEKYVDGYDKYNSKYEAYGIINHMGNLGYGHYTAYCKNVNGEWYEYNDMEVRKLSSLRTDDAYVIFYRKKN